MNHCRPPGAEVWTPPTRLPLSSVDRRACASAADSYPLIYGGVAPPTHGRRRAGQPGGGAAAVVSPWPAAAVVAAASVAVAVGAVGEVVAAAALARQCGVEHVAASRRVRAHARGPAALLPTPPRPVVVAARPAATVCDGGGVVACGPAAPAPRTTPPQRGAPPPCVPTPLGAAAGVFVPEGVGTALP